MLRQTPSRRSGLSAQGNSGLEPARESRSSCHRMEIYSQAGPQKTWLHNHAVTVLVEVNLLESQTLQQTAGRRSRILLGRSQNAIGQRGLLHLTFRLLAHLRFQIRVGGYQQPSLSGIHPGLRAVEPGAEHLRRGKMQVNLLAIHSDVVQL